MRTIIAASRTLSNPETIAQAVDASGFDVTEVILTGLQSDEAAGEIAGRRNVPTRQYDTRNEASRQAMLSRAGAAIILTDGEDKTMREFINLVSVGPAMDIRVDLRPQGATI